MVYKYTSSLNFNVLTTFTLQPSSVFHCLKKCSPHFALNWWVCIAKVGYKHHQFRNRFIREIKNWRYGMEWGGDQELPGLDARKACPGASPQHTHCSTLRTENWTWTLPHTEHPTPQLEHCRTKPAVPVLRQICLGGRASCAAPTLFAWGGRQYLPAVGWLDNYYDLDTFVRFVKSDRRSAATSVVSASCWLVEQLS